MVDRFANIVRHLVARPTETEWIEFKVNNADPYEIGEQVSGLANAAALVGEAYGYIVWGVRNDDHAIVGTTFDYRRAKIGAEELENWLHHSLSPSVAFRFQEGFVDNRKVVLLRIPAASSTIVRFKNSAKIRIGSYLKNIEDYQQVERDLWRKLASVAFEAGLCAHALTAKDALGSLVVESYYKLLDRRQPVTDERVLQDLKTDKLIVEDVGGDYGITNLGGILIAGDLNALSLGRKTPRVILYRGASRAHAIDEFPLKRGYAAGWDFLLDTIGRCVPREESIGADGIRRSIPVYPDIAIRELVANALIHQDFTITGAGPTVEIFEDRIEITNPGGTLIEPDRFIDSAPRSRNEALAGMMRRMGLCEERGSGIDKVVMAIESRKLPPLRIHTSSNETKVTIFARRPWAKMSPNDRIEATFQHAAVQAVQHNYLTNTSLRERFDLPPKSAATISRLIASAVEAGRIKSVDGPGGRSGARYVPYYAV